MSFEGSLQTVPLPEVLHLLADTSKSGELYVSGPGVGGRFWFENGEYCGYDVGRCDQAVDALFELLRVEHGDFVFDSTAVRPDSANRPWGADRADVRPVLERAEARLVEWREIVAVVPSLGHDVYLVSEPRNDQLSVDRAQWSLIVSIGEGRQVQEILDNRNLPEFDGCKAIKGLVDAGLAEVVDPVAAEAAAKAEAEAAEAAARAEEEAAALAEQEAAEAAARAEEEAAALTAQYTQDDVFDQDDASEFAAGPEEESPELIGVANDAGADESAHSARHALTALIDGIAADADRLASVQGDAGDDADAMVPHDGLADRGPWTSNELASLDHSGGWSDEAPSEEAAVEDEANGDESPEPINRGLLLKFLSSVRS